MAVSRGKKEEKEVREIDFLMLSKESPMLPVLSDASKKLPSSGLREPNGR